MGLDNKDNNIKKEIDNIKNKIIATAIVENNTELYRKILGLDEDNNSKTKENGTAKITINYARNPKKQIQKINSSINK